MTAGGIRPERGGELGRSTVRNFSQLLRRARENGFSTNGVSVPTPLESIPPALYCYNTIRSIKKNQLSLLYHHIPSVATPERSGNGARNPPRRSNPLPGGMDASDEKITANRDNGASDSSYTITDTPGAETKATSQCQDREIPSDTTDVESAHSPPPGHNDYGARDDKDAAQLERRASVATTIDFPEGGTQGWLVVLGSFCAMLSLFGLINSAAVFESYFSTHQLVDKTSSEIGWIFSLYLFIVFFVGIQVGPIFDRFGARALVATGSVLIFLSLLLLSWCEGMLTRRN